MKLLKELLKIAWFLLIVLTSASLACAVIILIILAVRFIAMA